MLLLLNEAKIVGRETFFFNLSFIRPAHIVEKKQTSLQVQKSVFSCETEANFKASVGWGQLS